MTALAGAVLGLGRREAGLVTPGAQGNARGNPTAESPRASLFQITAGWGKGREDATGREGLSPGLSSRPHLEAGIQAIRSAVDPAGSGNKRPPCAPSGTGFRVLVILEMNYCGRASVYTPEFFLRSRETVTGRGG